MIESKLWTIVKVIICVVLIGVFIKSVANPVGKKTLQQESVIENLNYTAPTIP